MGTKSRHGDKPRQEQQKHLRESQQSWSHVLQPGSPRPWARIAEDKSPSGCAPQGCPCRGRAGAFTGSGICPALGEHPRAVASLAGHGFMLGKNLPQGKSPSPPAGAAQHRSWGLVGFSPAMRALPAAGRPLGSHLGGCSALCSGVAVLPVALRRGLQRSLLHWHGALPWSTCGGWSQRQNNISEEDGFCWGLRSNDVLATSQEPRESDHISLPTLGLP